MLVEFVNALFTLKTTNEYLLYQGETPSGGFTKVSVMCNRAEGYNSQYFKIKQIIAEPGKQAIQQSLDLPNLESVHELIKLSLEEKGTFRSFIDKIFEIPAIPVSLFTGLTSLGYVSILSFYRLYAVRSSVP